MTRPRQTIPTRSYARRRYRAPPALATVGFPLGAVKILIVDDSKAFRDRLRRHLAEAAHVEVAGEASSGKEALVVIEAVDPDVILLDLEMPAGNGLAVLRRLRDLGSAIPVIIMTNHASDRVRERCVALGAHAVIDKLDVSSRLLPVLAELTHGRDR